MINELRYALRMLLKSPGFTAAAVLSLALGIGANTAVFSVVNTVLLKSLPYHQPDRLVLVWGEDKTQGMHRGQVSATDVADYRARNHVFEEISTYTDFRPVLTGAGDPERIFGAQIGDGFFDVMQAKPMLGRVFTAEEQVDGKDLVSPVRPALVMLFGAVVFLLLIACANVGNLLLARSIARYREVAIRAALGASRAQLVRQFLTESVLLSVAGGMLGLLGAIWSTSVIQTFGSRVIPMLSSVEMDRRVLGFTFVISMLTGLVFGSAPAFRASRVDLNETLNDGGRAPGAVTSRSPLRSALVVTEVALAMVLLIAAGLLIKTVLRLNNVNPGFNPEHVLSMNVWLPRAKYPKAENWNAFYERMLQRVGALPGIEAAGLTSVLPVSDNFDRRTIEVEGQPKPPSELAEYTNYFVTPSYFRAMSIPVVRGRAFGEQDTPDAPLAVVISESLAKKLSPDGEAIGKRIRFYFDGPEEQRPWRTVVGIVPDVKQYGLDTGGTPALYVPQLQMPQSTMTLVVGTRTEPAAMIQAVRREIVALDPEQAVFSVATMNDVLKESISLRRVSMFLLAGFAALALLLAAIGIYGVLAQAVVQRTHEIGIRMALGAQVRDVLQLILSHGMALAGCGILAGVAGALGVTRLLSNLLFGVAPTDASTFIAISLLLGAVAFLACYLPARRAAKLDPIVALARN